jgi:hypothetical protein
LGRNLWGRPGVNVPIGVVAVAAVVALVPGRDPTKIDHTKAQTPQKTSIPPSDLCFRRSEALFFWCAILGLNE